MTIGMNSTIDWCEGNYEVTPFVAEFWNTISGVAILLSGYLFKKFELQQYAQNITGRTGVNKLDRVVKLLYVVGVCTMLFHGTLLYPFQLLDELPMIMVSMEYIDAMMSLLIVRSNAKISPYIGNITSTITIVKIMMTVISVVYFVHPILQVLSFHITLKVCETTLVYILYQMNVNLNGIVYNAISNKYAGEPSRVPMNTSTIMFSMDLQSTNAKSRNIGRLEALKASQDDLRVYFSMKRDLQRNTKYGLLLYGTSVGIWVLENLFCEYTKGLQLHALWHVLSSLGIYHLSSIILTYIRIDELSHQKSN